MLHWLSQRREFNEETKHVPGLQFPERIVLTPAPPALVLKFVNLVLPHSSLAFFRAAAPALEITGRDFVSK